MKTRGSRLARVLGSSRLNHWPVAVRGRSRMKSVAIEAASARRKSHPQTVDACLRNMTGRRHNVNICPVDDMVRDRNIRILNDCVNAVEHHRKRLVHHSKKCDIANYGVNLCAVFGVQAESIGG
jgi:hypothetical protein